MLFMLRWTFIEMCGRSAAFQTEGQLHVCDINTLSRTVQWNELFAQDELRHFAGLLSWQLISGQALWALAQQGFLMLSVVATYLQRS